MIESENKTVVESWLDSLNRKNWDSHADHPADEAIARGKRRTFSMLFLLLLCSLFIHPVLFQNRYVAEAQDEWYEIARYAGNETISTPPINITATDIRAIWNFNGTIPDAEFSCWIMGMGPPDAELGFFGGWGLNGSGTDIFPTNNYTTIFLDISCPFVMFFEIILQTGANETKIPTSLTCNTDKVEYNMGQTVKVEGVLNPGLSGKTVTLTFKRPDNTTDTRLALTGTGGSYTYALLPTSLGNWTVRADFPGDETYWGSTSYTVEFKVLKKLSSLTCNADKLEYHHGEEVKISGVLNPPLVGENITLTFDKLGMFKSKHFETTGRGGVYNFTFSTFELGTFTVEASWPGNDEYLGALDTAGFIFKMLPSTLTCFVNRTGYQLGETVRVTGTLNPSLAGRIVHFELVMPDGSTLELVIITKEGGLFEFEFSVNMTGNYDLRVWWDGDFAYLEDVSYHYNIFTVTKIPTALTCFVDKNEYRWGDAVTINGTLTPPLPGKNITLTMRTSENESSSTMVKTKTDSSYSYMFSDGDLGIKVIEASWLGDETYEGATSLPKSYKVSKIPTILLCETHEPEYHLGDAHSQPTIPSNYTVIITGFLDPELEREIVTLTYWKPDNTILLRQSVIEVDGTYIDKFVPHAQSGIGSWSLKASWSGNEKYEGSISLPVYFNVTKKPTKVSMSVDRDKIKKGDTVWVDVVVEENPPIPGEDVTLIINMPDETTYNLTATTDLSGICRFEFLPDKIGIYGLQAYWFGNETYQAAISQIVELTVESECFIATATYGSEVSPEVQYLREFRDATVLSTFAGRSFMKIFNSFYYSFSPPIASTISGNNLLKCIMRAVLYPLMGILHISSATFSLFAFNQEFAVVLAGLVASSLIAVVYVTPGVLMLCLLTRSKPGEKIMRSTGIVWICSFLIIALAEAAKSTTFMAASTGWFVLVTMLLITQYSTRTIMKYLRSNHTRRARELSPARTQ